MIAQTKTPNTTKPLAGWGGFPRQSCRVERPNNQIELCALLDSKPVIARGNGRAYGDSALAQDGIVIDMRQLNRIQSFDPLTGILEVEAGALLADIITETLPQGWFPAVTPGTKFVTIGGMIAANIHGKNHHKHGSLGNFVDWIDLLDGDGILRRCSAKENSDLFTWTLGGMGLTGIILSARLRLRKVESGWIQQQLVPAPNLEAAMQLFESRQDATYSVAWIDGLAKGQTTGRCLLMFGEHAQYDALPAKQQSDPFNIKPRRPLSIPAYAPGFLLNRLGIRSFNALYYHLNKRKQGHSLIDWDRYFYPLDSLLHWNRIYGRAGFVQFQCVLPLAQSSAGLTSLLQTIAESGLGSFLSVLKRFGAQHDDGFAFPMEGYTLAMDFPASKPCLRLLETLDRIVIEHGGRQYLAKDARMEAKTLRQSDSRTEDFTKMRVQCGASKHFVSAQSERLKL